MQPIRSKRRLEFKVNPWTDTEHLTQQSEDAHVLADDGDVQSEERARQAACACGCLAPPGGYCADCEDSAPLCQRCLHHCVCGKPVCGRHSIAVTTTPGTGDRLCRSCHGTVSRKRIARTCIRALLSPFIRFKDHADE